MNLLLTKKSVNKCKFVRKLQYSYYYFDIYETVLKCVMQNMGTPKHSPIA